MNVDTYSAVNDLNSSLSKPTHDIGQPVTEIAMNVASLELNRTPQTSNPSVHHFHPAHEHQPTTNQQSFYFPTNTETQQYYMPVPSNHGRVHGMYLFMPNPMHHPFMSQMTSEQCAMAHGKPVNQLAHFQSYPGLGEPWQYEIDPLLLPRGILSFSYPVHTASSDIPGSQIMPSLYGNSRPPMFDGSQPMQKIAQMPAGSSTTMVPPSPSKKRARNVATEPKTPSCQKKIQKIG